MVGRPLPSIDPGPRPMFERWIGFARIVDGSIFIAGMTLVVAVRRSHTHEALGLTADAWEMLIVEVVLAAVTVLRSAACGLHWLSAID